MNAETLQKMLNTIRDNASEQYQERIPEATQTNLDQIGGELLGSIDLANEFTSSLMNKVALTIVHSRVFNNPLAILKKGQKPLGNAVEEIFVNYAKADVYDPNGIDLLNRKLPDVKAIYHTMNRKDKYKVTISRDMLAKAFTSYSSLSSMISGILNSLTNGANTDEFVITKKLFAKAVEDGAMKVVAIDEPTASETNASKFIKAVKTISGGMEFPSTKYNGYLNVQNTDDKPIMTFTPKSEQIIIIDNATNVACDVDVLAKAFNLDRVTFLSKLIVIDAFPDANVRACVIDVNFSQIYDDLFEMRTFQNGEGLYDNYILHVWQTIAYSPLVNAVAFSVASDEDSDGDVETFTITNTLKSGVTSTNNATEKLEGSRYTATLKFESGVTGTTTITMGGTDVTATAFDSTTNKISIAKVTGNIVVTVA